MTEEPLAIGASLLGVGILLNMAHSTVSEAVGVSINGWGWLLILVGLTVIGVRLYTMSQR